MLEVRNHTPFAAAIVPGLDKEGFDTATVIVKGTFAIDRARELAVAAEQQPIHYGDVPEGEPARSSVRFEADAAPAKPATDVVLVGHAYPPRPAPSVDVALIAGPVRKTVRVFGNRCWTRGLTGAALSDPQPFERMPLVYENAFGGCDAASAEPHPYPANPVGTGFSSSDDPALVEGLRAPNLEDPAALIARPSDRPAPAGFGFIGRGWSARACFAGTCDDAWRRTRCPCLPLDFDERFFQGAHPDLVAPGHFRGGEPVVAVNASPSGKIELTVPRRSFAIGVVIRGAAREHEPVLDTLVIAPDDGFVALTWKATFRCPRTFLYIEQVVVRERPA